MKIHPATKPAIPALALLAWLLLAQTAYCYYNSSTGRWLSRDPAEERAGENLYGLAANNPINHADLLGLVIICHCPEPYFSELGLVKDRDYEKASGRADYYVSRPGARVSYAGNRRKEIVWKMLEARERTFTAKSREVENLKRNVSARMAVVAATDSVRWTLGKPGTWNSAYWAGPLEVKQGVRWDSALEDPFISNPGLYTMGCRPASLLVMLEGLLLTVGPTEFNSIADQNSLDISGAAQAAGLLQVKTVRPGGSSPSMKEWVPGDRGWISGTTGRTLDAGEWIIYLGEDLFWGFWNPPKVTTLSRWMEEVSRFSQGVANETGQRWYPFVGLEN